MGYPSTTHGRKAYLLIFPFHINRVFSRREDALVVLLSITLTSAEQNGYHDDMKAGVTRAIEPPNYAVYQAAYLNMLSEIMKQLKLLQFIDWLVPIRFHKK